MQHLVTAVSSVLSVWETEARRDQLSVLHQPSRNQNQRALERVVVTDEADGWIFSVIRPRTEKFLRTANLEDPKIFLLLIYFRQSSFLSCTWGHEAAVANHSCFRVEAGLTTWTSSWFITGQHRDKPSTPTLTPLVYLYTNLSGFIFDSLFFFLFFALLSSIHVACSSLTSRLLTSRPLSTLLPLDNILSNLLHFLQTVTL